MTDGKVVVENASQRSGQQKTGKRRALFIMACVVFLLFALASVVYSANAERRDSYDQQPTRTTLDFRSPSGAPLSLEIEYPQTVLQSPLQHHPKPISVWLVARSTETPTPAPTPNPSAIPTQQPTASLLPTSTAISEALVLELWPSPAVLSFTDSSGSPLRPVQQMTPSFEGSRALFFPSPNQDSPDTINLEILIHTQDSAVPLASKQLTLLIEPNSSAVWRNSILPFFGPDGALIAFILALFAAYLAKREGKKPEPVTEGAQPQIPVEAQPPTVDPPPQPPEPVIAPDPVIEAYFETTKIHLYRWIVSDSEIELTKSDRDLDVLEAYRILNILDQQVQKPFDAHPFGLECLDERIKGMEVYDYLPIFRGFPRSGVNLIIGVPQKELTPLVLAAVRKQMLHEKNFGRSIFPIYYIPGPQTQFKDLLPIQAEILLRFIGRHPEDYLNTNTDQKTMLNQVLLSAYPNPSQLSVNINSHTKESYPGAKKMLKELADFVKANQLIGAFGEEIFEIMYMARPSPYSTTGFYLEFRDSETLDHIPPSYPFLQNLHKFVNWGGAVFLFTPPISDETLAQLTSMLKPNKVIRWQMDEDKLREFLDSRTAFLNPGLEGWCENDGINHDLTGQLIQAAQNQPGKLLRLGQALLKRVGQKKGLLTDRDLKDILK